MNILHLDEQRGWRGGEQQASYLIRGQAARGHHVVIAGRAGTPFLTRDHGAHLERIELPFLNELDVWTAARLAWEIRRREIDIIHAHTSHTHTSALVARGMARRGKVVVSRRVDFAPGKTLMNQWKYANPDAVVAISHAIAKILRTTFPNMSNVRVVHSAIDPKRFYLRPLSRESLGVPEDAPLIGNVAALVGHKDHATLIDAMAHVVETLPKANLVIAGEGEMRPQIEARIHKRGLDESVRLLGYRDDVPALMRALDVFALSSKEEGLGTSVLDAMVCKVPVAATVAGGIPEMVRNEETGLCVAIGDAHALGAAIVRLIKDKNLADALTAKAEQMVLSEFSVDTMVDENLRVYDALLSQGS